MPQRSSSSALNKNIFGTVYILRILKYTLFVSLSVFLLMSSLLKKPYVDTLRSYFLDFSTQMVFLVSKPIESFNILWSSGATYLQLHKKYQEMKARVEVLEHWEQIARHVNAENLRLRSVANMAPEGSIEFVTARAFEANGGAYSNSLFINAGTKQGIRKNLAVIAQRQIIGRVIEVGETSSRVLLLKDVNSKIPIRTEFSDLEAILTGSHTSTLNLSHLHGEGTPQKGELIFTSGKGGVFPEGYKVGRIASTDDKKITIRSDLDWENLHFVQVLLNSPSEIDFSSFSAQQEDDQ
jgi:rod shape-determining protein MreC